MVTFSLKGNQTRKSKNSSILQFFIILFTLTFQLASFGQSSKDSVDVYQAPSMRLIKINDDNKEVSNVEIGKSILIIYHKKNKSFIINYKDEKNEGKDLKLTFVSATKEPNYYIMKDIKGNNSYVDNQLEGLKTLAILPEKKDGDYALIVLIKDAVKLKNLTAEEHLSNGLTKLKEGDITNAIIDFDKAIELNPKLEVAYDYRGLAKVQSGDLVGAIQDYNSVIEINPKNREIYPYRGYVKQQLKDYRGAILDYTKSIELNVENIEMIYLNRGVAKEKLKDYQGAIRDYTKAIEINPKNNLAYLNRGLIYVHLDNKEAACIDFSKAGELGEKEGYENILKFCQ
ncbi:MAG: tetratricopeptide repeat protein [Bacteroidetes bacterium]|nr:tetratricopeptide repeat protein [Bacteroidota bacterium]HET6243587.1 tetratricopeptide repeat protein [Bacteroidia bacterium]